MRYTIIVVPDTNGGFSVMVPAMPGCFSTGQSRDEAIAHARDAMTGWLEAEAEQGRAPLIESQEILLSAVSEALAIIDEMRAAGEIAGDRGYALEMIAVDVPQPAVV